MPISPEINQFFKNHQMHYEDIDFESSIEAFKKEMDKGLAGDDASFMMLPTYIQLKESVPYGKPIIAIDAGGTNLRVGVVTLMEGTEPQMDHFNKYRMPGSEGHVSKDEFYSTLADYIIPLLDYSNVVSFCFSFPSEILPNQDGKVLYMTKEIYIDGIEETILGEEINKVLVSRGLSPKKFVVLNDTVAAMLGAIGHPLAEGHKGNIGFILGTGINSCYGERCQNITKVSTDRCHDDLMVINMESGGYTGFPQGLADKIIDARSKDPGKYPYEKMISGAYQGDLVYETTKLAAEDGLFSPSFSSSISSMDTFRLWDLAVFSESPLGDNPLAMICESNDDHTHLRDIYTMIQHRAARFVTITFGAIMQKASIGTDRAHPVAITTEGTTFQKSPIFREFLDQYTKDILNIQFGLYCSYLMIPDATMIGTAVAGLTI